MSEQKHTAGPWSAEPQGGKAAAPDMLEALKIALKKLELYEVYVDGEWGASRSIEEIERDGDLPEEIIAVRAAILKAEQVPDIQKGEDK